MNELIGKKCFVLYVCNDDGEGKTRVFFDELKAHDAMIADMERMINELSVGGDVAESEEKDDRGSVWIPCGNFYEWAIFETEIE